MQGWRKGMEDAHITALNVSEDVSLFGVFDGHGGPEVAQFVELHFVSELKKLELFKKGDYKNALIECFLKMDTLMITNAGRKELKKLNKSYSDDDGENPAFNAGCTACVALITKTEIYCANSGDSRAVLAKNGLTKGKQQSISECPCRSFVRPQAKQSSREEAHREGEGIRRGEPRQRCAQPFALAGRPRVQVKSYAQATRPDGVCVP